MQSNGLMPDTCAWIDYFRRPSTKLGLAVEKALSLEQVYTCGPIISELVQGVKSAREQSILLNAMQALPCLEMEQALWVKAGQLSASLRKQGKTLPFSDILIATLALEHNISILTADKHFKEIPKLNVRGVS